MYVCIYVYIGDQRTQGRVDVFEGPHDQVAPRAVLALIHVRHGEVATAEAAVKKCIPTQVRKP